MPATTDRPLRRLWTLGRLMLLIVLCAILLAPFAMLMRQRRIAQAEFLHALSAERNARLMIDRFAVATRQAELMRYAAATEAAGLALSQDEMAALQSENDRLRRRVAELEARVPAFPNPEPSQAVPSEGGLTLPANPD